MAVHVGVLITLIKVWLVLLQCQILHHHCGMHILIHTLCFHLVAKKGS